MYCARLEEKRCPKPVISNVDVSTNKIYFSAPNAHTVIVNRSDNKIKWDGNAGWPKSPRQYEGWTYIKIRSYCNGWNNESDIFVVKNPKPDLHYHGQIDRNGNPFEWEWNAIYDKNRQKRWIISKSIDCTPDTRTFNWSSYQNRLQCFSRDINDNTNRIWALQGGNIKLLQYSVERGTYYVPWIDQQRDKFDVEVINYVTQDWNYSPPFSRNGSKITNFKSHIWPTRK